MQRCMEQLEVSNIFLNMLPVDNGGYSQGGLGTSRNGYYLGYYGIKSFNNVQTRVVRRS